MGWINKLRDWLRNWLLTPDQKAAVHPNRVTLQGGETIIATGAAGLQLIAQERSNDDGSGCHRLISVQQSADPAQFWDVWERITDQSLTWQSDASPATPDQF